MVYASYPILYQRPKSFNRLSVDATTNVNSSRMLNAVMGVSLIQARIRRVFIGENNRLRKNELMREVLQSFLTGILHDTRYHPALASLAFHNPRNNRFLARL